MLYVVMDVVFSVGIVSGGAVGARGCKRDHMEDAYSRAGRMTAL